MEFNSPKDALIRVWGYNDFRPLQGAIIDTVIKGTDTLALLPTGGGKSLCYQVPALCLKGICIVVSPLIALMKDQVDQLEKLGLKAYAIYSGLSAREIDIILDNCIYNNVKYLYVSPERLKSELLQARVKKMNVSILAIDEAHCISQWGYEFRPSYLEISAFKNFVPEARLIALTATATKPVVKDILNQLDFSENHRTFIQSFSRPNLYLAVRNTEDKEAKMLDILKKVNGQSIVYARTRKRTKEISNYLLRHKISADYYHAGLAQEVRIQKQESWMKNKFRVMVATNAFGMGIDKPDVRSVIHMDLTDNLEAYYQEAGRAGRDGRKSFAVIVYHPYDLEKLKERIEQSSPKPELLRSVYQSLANFYKLAVGSSRFMSYDFELNDFVRTYNLDYISTFHALKKLEELGFLQLTDGFYHPSKITFLLDHMALYKFQVEQKQYESLIKALLRIYGGELYSNFVAVSEKKLAAILKTSTGNIEKKLQGLNNLNVLFYNKQKDRPQITFVTPRYDASKLPLDNNYLQKRIALSIEKMNAVIDYVNQENECRAIFLQEYFGEVNPVPCLKCDICISRENKLSNGNRQNELISMILDRLASGPLSAKDIIDGSNEPEEKDVFEALQNLLESEEIYSDELNRFYLSR